MTLATWFWSLGLLGASYSKGVGVEEAKAGLATWAGTGATGAGAVTGDCIGSVGDWIGSDK